MEMSSFFAFTS
uniref:Uncharacterized protein n=1 Tax=Anguilla anguilla TaxID=7936 RepID=A0A0E9RLD7_ANGAN